MALVSLQKTTSLEDIRFLRNQKNLVVFAEAKRSIHPAAPNDCAEASVGGDTALEDAGLALKFARSFEKSGSVESAAREALALFTYVISAQLAKRIGHKFGGDSLAPGHVEIRVVERLGDSTGEHGGFFDCPLVQGAAEKRFCGLRSGQRTAGCRTQDNAGVFDQVIPGQARRGGDGQHRKVERAAPPEFPVGALPSVQ